MRKFAIIISIIGLLILLFGCKKSQPNNGYSPKEINWGIEVSYLDNVKDTLYFTTPYTDCDCSSDEPEIVIYNSVSILRINYIIRASYVKSFRVLSKDQI